MSKEPQLSSSQDFLRLRKAYYKHQHGAESEDAFKIDTSIAIDWTECIEKATEYPIAVGGCGELFLGRWIDFPKDLVELSAEPKVIIKDVRMLADEFRDDKLKRKKEIKLKREVDVWQRVSHQNVLPFLGVANYPGRLPSLIFSFMENGDVKQYINSTPGVNRNSILMGVTNGLLYLHTFSLAPIIHGDIKAENILVDDKGNPRLADFGLSKLKGELTTLTTKRTDAPGTARWMAPELFGDQLSVTLESDVWAYGMTCLEIMTGHIPFHMLTTVAVMLAVAFHAKTPDRPSADLVPEELWLIWRSCWAKAPSDRPTMQKVMAWMTDYVNTTNFDSTIPLPPDDDDDDDFDFETLPVGDDVQQPNPDSPPGLVRRATPSFSGKGLDYDYGGLWKFLPKMHDNVSPIPLDGIADWTGWLDLRHKSPISIGGYNNIFIGKWVNLPKSCTTPPSVTIRVRRSTVFTRDGKNRAMRAVARELHIWKKLSHRNILPLIGVVFLEGRFPSLVSPYMENGTAEKYFLTEDRPHKTKFLLELAEAISYLHSHEPPLVHGIITPSTILVDEHGRPRLSGFSLCRREGEHTLHPSQTLAVSESPPELFNNEHPARSTAGDVYMYSMTAAQIVDRFILFRELGTFLQLAIAIADKKRRPVRRIIPEADAAHQVKVLWEDYANLPLGKRPPRREVQKKADAIWARDEADDELWKLWDDCWEHEPEVRIDIKEVVKRMNAIVEIDPTY